MPKKQQPKQPKALQDMTEEEQRAQLERLRAEEAKRQARTLLLEKTGFYAWRDSNSTTQAGDIWIAAYAKALEDAAQTAEGLDTPSPELQDVIAAAIRELKADN